MNLSLKFKKHFFQCLFALFDRLCNEPSIISQGNYYINHQVNTLIIKSLHIGKSSRQHRTMVCLSFVLLQVLTVGLGFLRL